MPKSTTPRRRCTYPNCPNQHNSHGYCAAHLYQLKKGIPLRPLERRRPQRQTLAETAAYVEAHLIRKSPSGCWEFTGACNLFGYGEIIVGRRPMPVHRLMLMAHGEVARDQFVLHRCDNPPCCRPSHLYAGTPADNLRDAIVRGRMKLRKLTVKQAEEIRQGYAGGLLLRELAEAHGVCQQTISKIVHHKTYRY